MRWTWMVVLTLAAGCDRIQLDQLFKPLTRSAPEPPGDHCPHGGWVTQVGTDRDDDGQLDDTEVTHTEYFCATALTRLRPEPAGSHCEHGGQAVLTGVDVDTSGSLEDTEVTGTEYVCATPAPGVLVRTRQVLPGARCPLGGQLSHAGHDTDGDRLLDEEEIVSEVYGCMEADPVLARLSVRPHVRFDGCEADGTTVKVGPDLDRSRELEDAEVRGEATACININQARLSQRDVSEGAACPTGGTEVGLGEDTNGNGTLDEAETLARAYSCRATLTYEGDYKVAAPADLEALRAISRLRGNLTVAGKLVTELVLPTLVAVEGELRIDSVESLRRVELEGLRSVGQQVYVASNPELDTLVLGASPEQAVRIGTDLSIIANRKLKSLAGLAALAPQRDFVVGFNETLKDPGPLEHVRDLTGSVAIYMNDELRGFPLPNLTSVGTSMTFVDNRSLLSLDTLSQLTRVGGNLNISSQLLVVSLAQALQQLQEVGGVLAIGGNPRLETLGGLPKLRRVGSLSIDSNAVLQHVGPLPTLELVEDEVRIVRNPMLQTIDRFGSLRYAKRVYLAENPLLTEVMGFENLTWLSSLGVVDNGALWSLHGFQRVREVGALTLDENPELTHLNMHELARVTAGFSVTDNPKLPACRVSALADTVYVGPAGQRVIERNDEVTTCER
ncbi:hypothetical protein ACLESO_35575 [Pyxidicoccus sp. 3LG]